MIELIVEDRCEPCGACVEVCPTNVFEQDATGRPVIARQADCQTCFLCEIYCPADALFVDPDCDRPHPTDAAAVTPLLGQYRRESGWGEWADTYRNEHWRMGEIFARARALAPPVSPEKTPT